LAFLLPVLDLDSCGPRSRLERIQEAAKALQACRHVGDHGCIDRSAASEPSVLNLPCEELDRRSVRNEDRCLAISGTTISYVLASDAQKSIAGYDDLGMQASEREDSHAARD
jgi:hypothetical protein